MFVHNPLVSGHDPPAHISLRYLPLAHPFRKSWDCGPSAGSWLCPVVMLVSLTLVGCQTQTEDDSDRAAGTDAAATLRDVIEQYQATANYHDRGILRLHYRANGESVEEETEIFVDFVRPNRLQLRIARGINRLVIASDGKKFRTAVEDPMTDNLRGQVVERPSPPQLTVAEVYAATELVDPANPNTMLSVLMGMPLDLRVSQLGLLLPGSAFANVLSASTLITNLPPESIEGRTCERIQLQDSVGVYVFWIDRATRVVRRIEYPTDNLFRSVSSSASTEGRPQGIRLTLDLNQASFQQADLHEDGLPSSTDRQLVQYFVLPPVPLPSEQFGRKIDTITVADLNGVDQSSANRDGKIQVLIWWDNHPSSKFTLTRLEDLYGRYSDQQDRVVFRAICVQPPDQLDTNGVRQLAAQWGSTIPLARDPHAAGRDALNVDEAPTVAVLDSQQRLHLFEVGANRQIDQSVQVVLRRLLAGEDVASDLLKHATLAEERFQQWRQLASLDRAQQPVTTPKLSEATDFRELQSSIAWKSNAADAPGNLSWVTTNGSEPRLLVLDGMRDVIELDVQGKVIDKNQLELDEAAFVSQLRHAANASGVDYFVGFSRLGRHLFVFDARYKQILQYPDASQKHNGIMDVEMLDLDSDGQLELYVGFADPQGCHRVDLDGRRIWSNRRLPATLSLAGQSLARPPHLLATGEQGWILPISSTGRGKQPVTVGQRTIHQLTASSSATARPAQFLGMSYSIEGRLIAVGLDQGLEEQWSYGLPAGVSPHQVRSPVWAPLFGDDKGCWLLAGPDGSVHIIRDDGSFFDYICTGEHVIGLAGHAMGDTGRIYVVTSGSVTAYDLRLPENP